MQGILVDYSLNPTTWAYLSALLTIGIYFKFYRFWSVRNLDLLGLIAFSPGLLLVYHGLAQELEGWELFWDDWVKWGYIWLFSVGVFFLVRLLLDPVMVRRPLLEPNLSASGLTFTGAALLVFLMANVVGSKPAQRIEHVLARQEATAERSPGNAIFYRFASSSAKVLDPFDTANQGMSAGASMRAATARTAVILAHLAVVIGLVVIGYRHFDSIQTGVAVASLYLLLLYTSQLTARVDHAVPAALLVWAVAAYRRPLFGGICLGLAAGVIFYPLFLLPLWCSFYWRRGLARFAVGVAVGLAVMVVWLLLASDSFLADLKQMVGWTGLSSAGASGFWEYYEPAYRIPVVAAFVALSAGLALWPAQKNLGTLLSCSAAVMLGSQFWHAHQGGIYMAWYLPLLLLTIFRPNLEDRVALTAVSDSWIPRTQSRRLVKLWRQAAAGRKRAASPSTEDA